ncbi:hypothetical protein VCNEP21113_003766A, partial [Vibrio cholerae O1 str. Nep-21113]
MVSVVVFEFSGNALPA